MLRWCLLQASLYRHFVEGLATYWSDQSTKLRLSTVEVSKGSSCTCQWPPELGQDAYELG